MTEQGRLIQLLRNVPIRLLIKAIERDGFTRKRKTKAGSLIYSHPDGRMVVVHYHVGSDTLPRGMLKSFLEGTGWDEDDLTRLQLISGRD